MLGKKAVKCSHCGADNPDYAVYCGRCSSELRKPAAAESPVPAVQPQAPEGEKRHCAGCGRWVPHDSHICQYCGYDYLDPPRSLDGELSVSDDLRIVFYFLSIFVPLAGIVLGVILLRKPDEDSRRVGRMCLILGLVFGVVIPLISIGILFALMWSW